MISGRLGVEVALEKLTPAASVGFAHYPWLKEMIVSDGTKPTWYSSTLAIRAEDPGCE
jgi:hypothetical protein